jgi:hypothetical protein
MCLLRRLNPLPEPAVPAPQEERGRHARDRGGGSGAPRVARVALRGGHLHRGHLGHERARLLGDPALRDRARWPRASCRTGTSPRTSAPRRCGSGRSAWPKRARAFAGCSASTRAFRTPRRLAVTWCSKRTRPGTCACAASASSSTCAARPGAGATRHGWCTRQCPREQSATRPPPCGTSWRPSTTATRSPSRRCMQPLVRTMIRIARTRSVAPRGTSAQVAVQSYFAGVFHQVPWLALRLRDVQPAEPLSGQPGGRAAARAGGVHGCPSRCAPCGRAAARLGERPDLREPPRSCWTPQRSKRPPEAAADAR